MRVRSCFLSDWATTFPSTKKSPGDTGALAFMVSIPPASLNWIAARGKPPNMRVFPIAIAGFDGRQKFSLPENDGRGIFSTKATVGRHVISDIDA